MILTIFGLPAGAFTLVLVENGEYGIVVDDSSGVGVGIGIDVDVGSTVCSVVTSVGTKVVVETCVYLSIIFNEKMC